VAGNVALFGERGGVVWTGDSDDFGVMHPTLERSVMNIAYKAGPHHANFDCLAHWFHLSFQCHCEEEHSDDEAISSVQVF
jgi:hypothetical protein